MRVKLLIFFLMCGIFVPPVVSYDSELLGLDDLFFVLDNLGRADFDMRADYTGSGSVDLFDLVVVASHLGVPRSDARRWTLESPQVAPAVQELFLYADTQEFREDPHNWYAGSNPDAVSPLISLITQDPDSSFENYIRYTFPDRTDVDNRCSDFYISRTFTGGLLDENVTELWVEVWLRFSDNFNVSAPLEWGCTSSASYKLQFINTRHAGSEFVASGRHDIRINTRDNRFAIGTPGDVMAGVVWEYEPVHAQDLFDEQWHRLRQHVRYPSQPNSGRTIQDGSLDGMYRVWVNEYLFAEIRNYSTSHARFSGVMLGANMNQGPGEEIWIDRANLQIFTEDPGWDTSNPYHLIVVGE